MFVMRQWSVPRVRLRNYQTLHPQKSFELEDMLMIGVLTLYRNQTQVIFDSLVGQLIRSSIISSEDMIIRGLKIWNIASYLLLDSSTIGGTTLITVLIF